MRHINHLAACLTLALLAGGCGSAPADKQTPPAVSAAEPPPAFIAQEPTEVERELAEIVQRLDADEPATRELAAKDLAAFRKRRGKAAVEAMRKCLASIPSEPRARVQAQLDFVDKVEAARKRLGIFDLLELPGIADKKLVLYNTGRYATGGNEWTTTVSFTYALGWISSESDSTIRLIDATLDERTFKRDRKLPDGWDRLKASHPVDKPLPGEYVEVDFEKFCSTILKDGKRGIWNSIREIETFRHGIILTDDHLTLCAWWALQRRMDETALELVELWDKGDAQKAHLSTVAANLEYQAITGAHEGLSLPDVLKKWKILSTLPRNDRTDRARRMVRAYEDLIAEGKQWKEPAADEIGRMSPAQKAAYWVHALRDCAAYPEWAYSSTSTAPRADRRDPHLELKTIRWDAIPLLIEHLDDSRPTRSFGCWRTWEIGSYLLGEIRGCCEEILNDIAGDLLSEDDRFKMSPQELKQAWTQWWVENEKLGAEGYYLKRLEGNAEERGFAAARLLEIGKEKHLPRLVALAGRTRKNSMDRMQILKVLVPHLDKRHQDLLRGFLEDYDSRTLLVAANRLWDLWGDDSGAREIVARLSAVGADKTGLPYQDDFFDLLKRVRTDFVIDAFCSFFRHPSKSFRGAVTLAAREIHHPNVAEALAGELDNAEVLTSGPWWNGLKDPRVCDLAAIALAGVVGWQRTILDEPDRRDAFIAELKAWWAANKDKIDWDELGKQP